MESKLLNEIIFFVGGIEIMKRNKKKQYVVVKVLENALKHDVNDLLNYEM